MKIVKEKYKLILEEPGKEIRTLTQGTKKECEKKKLEFSFSYNSEWLRVEEDEPEIKEVKTTLKGILEFLAVCSLTYLCWIGGKKIYITD